MRINELETELKPLLKEMGYRKNRLTWYKCYAETTVVFSVQKSLYGPDVWYYCFGVDVIAINGKHGNSIDCCQVLDRYNQVENGVRLTPQRLIQMIQTWECKYGTIIYLQTRILQGEMPIMTHGIAIKHLAISAGVPESTFANMTPTDWKAYYRNSLNLTTVA